jgi:hypothetical protein
MMAIEERDREDLLRDGKMMPLRGETKIDGKAVVVGFRKGVQMSLYCGADPVFQFNADHQLRRVFFDGQRYAAQNGKLVLLIRETIGGRVTFAKHSVSAERESEIKKKLSSWFLRIRQATETSASTWHILDGQDANATKADFVAQVRHWFNANHFPQEIANQPNA